MKRLNFLTIKKGRMWTGLYSFTAVLIIVVGGIFVSSSKIIPSKQAYEPLLATIAKGESSGNYNAYYNNAQNNTIQFTKMPVNEVLRWQDNYIKAGNPSNAVGKYQIIGPTLAGLVRQLNVDQSAEFNEQLQDTMAIALLERRGSIEFANNQLSREAFAANLAKEWAALPRVIGANPAESFYAGDGLNKANISVDQVFVALEHLSFFTQNCRKAQSLQDQHRQCS